MHQRIKCVSICSCINVKIVSVVIIKDMRKAWYILGYITINFVPDFINSFRHYIWLQKILYILIVLKCCGIIILLAWDINTPVFYSYTGTC